MSEITSAMVEEWLVRREAAKQIEAGEHPDLIDAEGRRWTWVGGGGGDLWRHEHMAWPRDFLPEPVSLVDPREA